jgi:hypothetical protein
MDCEYLEKLFPQKFAVVLNAMGIEVDKPKLEVGKHVNDGMLIILRTLETIIQHLSPMKVWNITTVEMQILLIQFGVLQLLSVQAGSIVIHLQQVKLKQGMELHNH